MLTHPEVVAVGAVVAFAGVITASNALFVIGVLILIVGVFK